MSSIDLYDDFNDGEDVQAGNFDEGGDHERSGDENQVGDADEEQKEEVQAKVKVIRVKRKKDLLNPLRLKGPRGIMACEDFFKDMKYKGKGYEKQDLDEVMKRMELWAHRMYPKYTLDDSLAAIEKLGKKKEIAFYMDRYRRDQLTRDSEELVLSEEDDDRREQERAPDEPMDEFEALIDEQIALSTVHNRTRNSDKSFGDISGITNASRVNENVFSSTRVPKFSQQPTTSSQTHKPSQPTTSSQTHKPIQPDPPLSDEIRARIAENKKRALAILEARRKEAEEKARQKEIDERPKFTEISNVLIDDDDE